MFYDYKFYNYAYIIYDLKSNYHIKYQSYTSLIIYKWYVMGQTGWLIVREALIKPKMNRKVELHY